MPMATAARALLAIDVGKLLFIGPMCKIPDHACLGTVVAVGLEGEFDLLVAGQQPRHGRCLLAPAGATRSVDAHGGRLAVCLIDPGIPVQLPRAPDQLIEMLAGLSSRTLIAQWPHLWSQLGLSARPAVVDERVAKVAAALERHADENIPAQALADAVGLSASRLEHLFVEHQGVPMRSYRTWLRFRNAALAMATGATLTEAAHRAGFYDHAHFGRAFRQAFGVTPSFVLGPDIQFCAIGQG